MSKTTIKGILTDFDQTLFDTHTLLPLVKQKTPDWKLVFTKVPEYPLYNGWRWVLANLRHIPLGIVSGNIITLINKFLKHNKIEVFKPVIGRYGEGKRRFRPLPKTELFELALQHDNFKGLKREEVLYLGDEAKDMIWVKEFGILSGGCFWGTLEPYQLSATNPTFRLNTPDDILALLNS